MTGREMAQAVSVAVAYFEDTLKSSPEVILSAGTVGADALRSILEENGFEGAHVREIVGPRRSRRGPRRHRYHEVGLPA